MDTQESKKIKTVYLGESPLTGDKGSSTLSTEELFDIAEKMQLVEATYIEVESDTVLFYLQREETDEELKVRLDIKESQDKSRFEWAKKEYFKFKDQYE